MDNFHTIDDDFNTDDKIVLNNRQYTSISNAYCNLRHLQSKLSGVIDTQLLVPLTDMLKILLDEVIDPRLKIENQKFLERQKYLEIIEKENNFNNSTWSMDEPKNFNELCSLIPLKHQKSLEKRVIVRYSTYSSNSYGGIFSTFTNGVTWLDMWQAANEVIRISGDDHHIFIENFQLLPSGENGYLVLELVTGS